MDEQAEDSAESVAELNQSRLGGTAVSEALALPAPSTWSQPASSLSNNSLVVLVDMSFSRSSLASSKPFI